MAFQREMRDKDFSSLPQTEVSKFKVKLRNAKNNIKNLEGCITDFSDENFTIECNDENHIINFSDTELCRLNPSFDDILRTGEEYGR